MRNGGPLPDPTPKKQHPRQKIIKNNQGNQGLSPIWLMFKTGSSISCPPEIIAMTFLRAGLVEGRGGARLMLPHNGREKRSKSQLSKLTQISRRHFLAAKVHNGWHQGSHRKPQHVRNDTLANCIRGWRIVNQNYPQLHDLRSVICPKSFLSGRQNKGKNGLPNSIFRLQNLLVRLPSSPP